MKKTIITMLIALVAMFASAETYSYLKFTRVGGSTVTYSVEGLKLTYDSNNVYVTNAETSATIPLADVQEMYFSNEGGTTPAAMRGDVNGDGLVSIDDVTALIDYLLGGDATGINLDGADCNQDGGVNIDDVTTLIDHLLGGSW